MKKQVIVGISSLLVLAIGAVGVSIDETSGTPTKADSTYTITISSGVTVASGEGTVSTTKGTPFVFSFSNYSGGSNTFGSFTSGGLFANKTLINGISQISVTFLSGSLTAYNGWTTGGTDITYASSGTSLSSSSSTFSMNGNYFKLVASESTSISSISITYSCAEPTTVSSLRVTVASPLVSGSAPSSSNYLWGSTDIFTYNTYVSYLFTSDGAGSYYHDFTDVPVYTSTSSQKYLSLYLSSSSSSLSEWGYGATGGGISLYVYPGETEITLSDKTFTDEPSVATNTYTLSTSITISGTGSTMGNIQFVYNYTNSTTSYSWPATKIGTSFASSYTYSLADLNTDKTLYFKIYIYDSSLGNCYIGDTSGANFSLKPNSGATAVAITLSFAYPASTSTVGTLGITSGAVKPSELSSTMTYSDVDTSVYGDEVTIAPTFDKTSETFTAAYTGNNIRIDDNKTIVGLVAGTSTSVTLTSVNGLTCSFTVNVAASTYSSNYGTKNGTWPTSESWWSDPSVSEISGMGSTFMNGIDISSCRGLYKAGSKFYDSTGNEESLFYLLKDAGVNWVRLRLWNDPYTASGVSYGGGECDLANVTWMAHEAKAAGLKVLLDFHYSDFWAHPGQQILPKAWTSYSSVSDIASALRTYTSSTLTTLKNASALPDMVQLGNELTSGILLDSPGSDSDTFTSYEPNYLYSNSSLSSSLAGTSGTANMVTYLTAASNGVDDVDSSIKKMIHWAKGSTFSSSVINSFFNNLSSVDYDYAGLSAYPYYHFSDGLSTLSTVLNGISITNDNGSVPFLVAETSYPFTSSAYVYDTTKTNANVTSFSVTSSNYTAMTNYPYTIAGQSKMIRDITSAVVTAGGVGVFDWEGAWTVNSSVGWAGANSPNSWGNQAFFSFDGKALGSLLLYKEMNPNV